MPSSASPPLSRAENHQPHSSISSPRCSKQPDSPLFAHSFTGIGQCWALNMGAVASMEGADLCPRPGSSLRASPPRVQLLDISNNICRWCLEFKVGKTQIKR